MNTTLIPRKERPTPESDRVIYWDNPGAASCTVLRDLEQRLAESRDSIAEKDAQILALREVLGMNQAWCLLDVLQSSAEALDHLFEFHACDADGWENWCGHRERLRAFHTQITTALSTPPPPVVPLEDVRPLVEALTRYDCHNCLTVEQQQDANDTLAAFLAKHPLA